MPIFSNAIWDSTLLNKFVQHSMKFFHVVCRDLRRFPSISVDLDRSDVFPFQLFSRLAQSLVPTAEFDLKRVYENVSWMLQHLLNLIRINQKKWIYFLTLKPFLDLRNDSLKLKNIQQPQQTLANQSGGEENPETLHVDTAATPDRTREGIAHFPETHWISRIFDTLLKKTL